MSEMACLITGGAGAIGSHLVEALLALGARVDVIDDLSSGRRENLPPDQRVRLIVADVTVKNLKDVVEWDDYHYVFHLAAHFANHLSIEEPDRDMEVNILGTLNVLRCLNLSKVKRFIFASSSCVYGPYEEENEEFPITPSDLDTPYAISKYASEALVNFYARNYGLKTTILRYFNSYGPRDFPGFNRSVIPNFFAFALKKQPLPIYGTGEEMRDFTYVEDVAKATVEAAGKEETSGLTINIGTGKGVTIRELAFSINELTGNPAGVVYLPPRPWDRCQRRIPRLERARALLGLGNPTPLAEGLQKTWEWIKSCGNAFPASAKP
ncbi:MAG: NAD-dependent epimerase/dehydratase family protein [Firmicutes bacterium]|nr:NAD-dependent epimerase/dehydratase family protein [Bacillota bacterium]